jgi:predicted hotdog family 3-hydroxylacyl-ACP dehydratase
MMMKASSEAVIAHPAERIVLMEWLTNLSDREYQACSRGHRAAGVFRENGRLGSINVETVGGHLLIQHYLDDHSRSDHVVMRSRNTRVYVRHLVPATIEVIWTLDVVRRDSTTSVFRCTVESRIPTLLGLFAAAGLLPLFLRWHVEEETPIFARDIARKTDVGALGTTR